MLTLISKSYAVVPITTIFPEVPWDIIFTISFSDISICSWNICWTTLGVLNNIIFAPLFCTFVLFTAESIFDAAPLSSVSTHIFPSTIPGRCDSICTHIAISSSPKLSACSLFSLTVAKNLRYISDCLKFFPSSTSAVSFSSFFNVSVIVLTGDFTILTAQDKYSFILSFVEKHSERMSYVYSSLNITTLISASAIFFMNAIYSSAKLCLSDASSIKMHFVINTTVPCIL